MPFIDIACHVWAIDGYLDDTIAKSVNSKYTHKANELRVEGNKQDRSRAVKALVDEARSSQVTKHKIIVYGGFRRGQNAPEHMWFEYAGMIYETMPGQELTHERATRDSRTTPQLENEKFSEAYVGVYNTFMTVNQEAYLRNQGMVE